MERVLTGSDELDRVLGGGLVPGSIVLIGGAPGIGKSTLMTSALASVAGAGRRVVYVSGEESAAQVRLRAERLGPDALSIPVLAETSLHRVLDSIAAERPEVCVVDSVQTLYSEDLTGAPGSVGQVREVAARLERFARERGCAVVLVGHVTKDGTLAGPRVLEHAVDCVLQFEGEPQRTYRTLRALKNRFGSTNEIGVFEMRVGRPDGGRRPLRALPRRGAARGRFLRAVRDGGHAATARGGAGAHRSFGRRPPAPDRQWRRPQPPQPRARDAGAPRRAVPGLLGRVRERCRRRADRGAGRGPGRRAGTRLRCARRAARRAGPRRWPASARSASRASCVSSPMPSAGCRRRPASASSR